MSLKSEAREQVWKCAHEHPDWTKTQIAAHTGVPWMSVKRYLQTTPPVSVPGLGVRKSDTEVEVVSENPKTLEELLQVCEVDQTKWRVARWVANKWEVGTKLDDGSVLRTPLYQVKATLEPVPGAVEADALREALDELRKHPPVPPVVRRPASPLAVDDPHLLEISLADLHFDRLVWGEESGENWDSLVSRQVASRAVERLLHLSSAFPVSRILYVCGHDFFTADSPNNTTTAGTPQTVDGRWQKSFKLGVQLQIAVIERLRQRAPVDIVIVPGNHDSTRTFYLGCVLEATYAKTEDVRIFNSPSIRKYYRWGTVLIGHAHGHTEKHAALPLIMAGEAKADWAETTHREFHVGHLHQMRETQFHAGVEFGPVRVRILPSLTATDAWHSQSGYVGTQKASEAYVWSFNSGYVGHFSWSPPREQEDFVVRPAA